MIITKTKRNFKKNWKNTPLAAFEHYINDDAITSLCQQLGIVTRECNLTPKIMILSQVFRALSSNKSIQSIITLLTAQNILDEKLSNSAWDQARSRLPIELLFEFMQRIAAKTEEKFSEKWFGKDVFLVDGSTVSMPDTPALVAEFGYCNGKYGDSRFPVARMLVILNSSTKQITDYELTDYKTSELGMFRKLLFNLPKGSIWVADRYYSSPVEYILSQRHEVDLVTRLHQRRDGKVLAKQGKRLGKDDWLVRLPICSPTRRKYAELALPEEIEARLIRVRYKNNNGESQSLWLITSLLDAVKFPRENIVELYRSRWGIETHYAYLKTTLEMAVLRSKTSDNIRKEVAAIMLAHNLIWLIMHEAGEVVGLPATRLSFKNTVGTIQAYGNALRYAASLQEWLEIYDEMLRYIGGLVIPERSGRHEPRLIKRSKTNYKILNVSREEARRCA